MSNIATKTLLVAVVLIAGLPVWADDIPDSEQILVIGAIDSDVEGRYAQLRPMADYIAELLADLGVSRVDIRVVEDRRRLARMMQEGRIDWTSVNAATAVYLQETAGAKILARKWKQGAPQFRSVFFTRTDSAVRSLNDLDGHIIAFLERDSIAGHIMPVAEMIRAGHRAARLDTPRQRAPSGSIGYAFSGSEINATTWVHKRIADAGVMSNVDWESTSSLPDSFRKDFVIFHQTDPMPRALELVRGDLGPEMAAALKEALLAMDQDGAAAGALQAYEGTLRFDDLDPKDSETLNRLRSTFTQLMLVN